MNMQSSSSHIHTFVLIQAVGLFLLGALPCFAQMDIKIFNKIGEKGIIKLLGEPIGTDGDGSSIALLYPDRTGISIDESTKELVAFNTLSPKYCILSDDVQGGFRVGDRFSKVQAFDFVHSRYGKNRPGNALELIDSTAERDYYIVYSEEWYNFYFRVKDGIIIGIDMGTPEEYNGQDMTNKLW